MSASPEDEVKSKHADILDWGEDIISINRLDTQQSMPNDENETSHLTSRNSKVSSSSLDECDAYGDLLFSSLLFSFEVIQSPLLLLNISIPYLLGSTCMSQLFIINNT